MCCLTEELPELGRFCFTPPDGLPFTLCSWLVIFSILNKAHLIPLILCASVKLNRPDLRMTEHSPQSYHKIFEKYLCDVKKRSSKRLEHAR